MLLWVLAAIALFAPRPHNFWGMDRAFYNAAAFSVLIPLSIGIRLLLYFGARQDRIRRAAHQHQGRLCVNCLYPHSNATVPAPCPECGVRFDPRETPLLWESMVGQFENCPRHGLGCHADCACRQRPRPPVESEPPGSAAR